MKFIQHKASQKQQRPKKKRRLILRNALSILLAIIALGLLFYPIVVNFMVAQQNLTTIQNYRAQVSKIPAQKEHELLASARLYNEYIYAVSQGVAFKKALPDYNKQLSLDESGMMGYIAIPQINVRNVPIYHGDSEKILFAGVGHIPQTSLPIGGINTHAVLPAHSGRINNTLFTELDKLKLGDVFYLSVLDLDLKYKIDNIKVVDPKDISSLNVIKGKDLVTLVTCYPTGINNKRLLVTGERVPYNQKLPNEAINRNSFGYNFWVMLVSGVLALLGLVILLYCLLANQRPLYQVSLEKLEKPTLAHDSLRGDFGAGFYLVTSKSVAIAQAEKIYPDQPLYLNVYRLRKHKELSRWIFKNKSENWKKYLSKVKNSNFVDKEHELIIGPHPTARKAQQYCLKSPKALAHLHYLKSIPLRKGKEQS
ncbi:class C sortase [Lactococcus taiwanensis]|uniref:class C sortase n=1 Tax=Lactococcus taiwanensis TaxID=1151742 RepID=UPI0019643D4C|nr:class C sortase [Lactococcus taiwanensis]QRZ10944.1 class C sortase [Lactococcus taiwanensis]